MDALQWTFQVSQNFLINEGELSLKPIIFKTGIKEVPITYIQK